MHDRPWKAIAGTIALGATLLLPAPAGAHSVPSTKAEQQAGLQGQRHHLKRAQWHHRGAVRHCRRARVLTATQDCRRHHARYKANQRRLQVLERRLHPYGHTIRGIVYGVFQQSGQGSNAVRVVHCETGGTWNPRLIGGGGGNYYGLFQFGPWARSAYGFSWDPLDQTRRAYRLWRALGWSQWECASIVGII